MGCASCQFENTAGSRFCAQCGARLAARGEAGGEGERRQITAFFCDLVGSSELARGLDPEDWAAALRDYHALCREAVVEHGGYVAQYLGDGVLAYFGYPRAGEHDAEMAGRAGLELLARLERRNRSLAAGGTALRARVGLHTGPVVVETVGGEGGERLALGDTPNLAAHLQGAAAPGTVLASEATADLVRGLFVIDVRADVVLKSSAEPVTAYRLVRASGMTSRFAAAASAGRTALVGRTAELALLRERWVRARGGAGQCVVINGEPGIGKSRLIEALQESLQDDAEAVNWVSCSCVARLRGSSMAPLIELVRRAVGVDGEDAERDASRVALAVEVAGLDAAAVPLLCAFLSVPPPPGAARPEMSPLQQRRRTLDVLVEWLVGASSIRPIAVVVDDIQWADPSTLELLGSLVERLAGARVLALFAQRPGPVPWSGEHVSLLSLGRLSEEETRLLVAAVVSEKAVGRAAGLVDAMVARADGVPLFAEELSKMVMESDSPNEVSIPATLQDSLMSRLDRLGAVKELAQLGSVIGREFSAGLLGSLAGIGDAELRSGLDELVRSGLVHRRSTAPDDDEIYVFKHALVQDVAYQSLLRSRRRVLHGSVGDALAARRRAGGDVDPVLLAHHYTRAEQHEPAIQAWEEAARRAIVSCAAAEASQHLARAREIAALVDGARRRDELALGLDLTEMYLHQTVHGPAADGVGAVLGRAHGLATSLGAKEHLFAVTLFGCGYLSSRESVADAHRLGLEALAIADQMAMPALEVAALVLASTCWLQLGEYEETVRRCERGIALYEPPGLLGEGINAATILMMNEATARWALGQRGRGFARLAEGIRSSWSGTGTPPVSAGWALTFLAWLHLLEGEVGAARETLDRVLDCAERGGFDILAAFGRCWQVCAQLVERADPALVAELEQALTAHPQVGPVVSYQRAVLALAYARLGDPARADALFVEILERARARSEKHGEEELLRLRAAALLLAPGQGRGAAEACLRESIALARARGALGFELRSTVTLAELMRDSGRAGAAHDELAGVLARLAERDGPDVARAECLLAAPV